MLISCFGTVPALGARIARATFEPDLMMTDNIASSISDILPVSGEIPSEPVVEAWLPFRTIFELLWSGTRHVMMVASQIDRYGNQNFACIGPHEKPKAQLLGMRGAPGNTINHRTSYWVPKHSPRVFVEQVDVVSGVGYDRAAELGPRSSRFHHIHRVPLQGGGALRFDAFDVGAIKVGYGWGDAADGEDDGVLVAAEVALEFIRDLFR